MNKLPKCQKAQNISALKKLITTTIITMRYLFLTQQISFKIRKTINSYKDVT